MIEPLSLRAPGFGTAEPDTTCILLALQSQNKYTIYSVAARGLPATRARLSSATLLSLNLSKLELRAGEPATDGPTAPRILV